jgi:GH24 family phage-related lysozyme (muramidase)
VKTSQTGLTLIETNEGFCATIKPDNIGSQIGFGHDLLPSEIAAGTYSNGITMEGAVQLLITDLTTRFEPTLNRLVPPYCTQNQYDACADFIYNEGPRNFATMIHHGWNQVPVQMLAWVYAEENGVLQKVPGLIARRQKEVALFTKMSVTPSVIVG